LSKIALDDFGRVEMLNQLAVKQIRVAIQERVKAIRASALEMYSDEAQPGARQCLVVLLLGTVKSGHVTDRCDQRLGRFLRGRHPQVGPSQLEMLAVPGLAPDFKDLLENFAIARPHHTKLPPAPYRRKSR
jgi:gluconate kinase